MEPPCHTAYFRSGVALILTGIFVINQPTDLLLEPGVEAGQHAGAARQHDAAEEVATDVQIAVGDALVCDVLHTGRVVAEELGAEERLGTAEALFANLFSTWWSGMR